MSNRAEFFNSIADDPQYKSQKLIKDLNIEAGNVILDYGSGGGYFTFAFSKLVGSKGTVYATDINEGFLNRLNEQTKKQMISNIQSIHVSQIEDHLNEDSIDLIFIRNVTHHLENRTQIFHQLRKFLKQDSGKFVIIDYTPQGNKLGHGPLGHFVRVEDIKNEMEEANYLLKESIDYLQPAQSFSIFVPKPK